MAWVNFFFFTQAILIQKFWVSADKPSEATGNISVILCDSAIVSRAQIRAMRNLWPETLCQTQVSHISELILIDVTAS